jgi:hypothetical protein
LNVLIGIRMEMMMWSQTLRHSKELQSTAWMIWMNCLK